MFEKLMFINTKNLKKNDVFQKKKTAVFPNSCFWEIQLYLKKSEVLMYKHYKRGT